MATREILLPIMLEVVVPIKIWEIQQKGGISNNDIINAKSYVRLLCEKGDQLFFKGKDTATVFNAVVDSIAILAFCPGGIDIFGLHFEGNSNGGSKGRI